MLMLGKCVFIACIIFMLYPRRVRPALAEDKLQNAKKGILRQEVRADDKVGGFDLTDEEIIKFKIWPQGVIPYYIDVLSFKDKVLRDRIRGFLNAVNGLTGINFLELHVPPQDEKSRWVFFVNRRGLLDCADHSIKNFTNEGVQHVVLGYDCMSADGELAEAVLAIAGLPPQHNAPNRDEYIRVVDDNIIPEKRYLFEKLNNNEWLFHDIAYDFYSAGHYHSHKYSANGRATIETQKNFVDIPVGEGNTLSNSDILKIRMLYSFISKKKQGHIPECHKLFQPGKHFKSFKPIKSIINPRKKPNKYLGVADEEKSVAEDDINDDDDTKKETYHSNDKVSEDIIDADDTKKEANDNNDNVSDNNQNVQSANPEEYDPDIHSEQAKVADDISGKKKLKIFSFGRPGYRAKIRKN